MNENPAIVDGRRMVNPVKAKKTRLYIRGNRQLCLSKLNFMGCGAPGIEDKSQFEKVEKLIAHDEKMLVFVLTYNSGRTLRKCLKSIMNAIPKAQIVLMDKFSSDETLKIASQFKAIVFQSNRNRGQTRELAYELANGKFRAKWFCMVDSDEYLCQGWLKKLLNLIGNVKDEKIGGIYGISTPCYEPFKSYFDFRHSQLNFPVKNQYFFTDNCVIRTEAVKGFKCDINVYEDYLTGKYIESRGFNHYQTNEAFCVHDKKFSMKDYRDGGAGLFVTTDAPLWYFFLSVFYYPLLKVPKKFRILAMKIYLNWFFGALNWRRHIYGK